MLGNLESHISDIRESKATAAEVYGSVTGMNESDNDNCFGFNQKGTGFMSSVIACVTMHKNSILKSKLTNLSGTHFRKLCS